MLKNSRFHALYARIFLQAPAALLIRHGAGAVHVSAAAALFAAVAALCMIFDLFWGGIAILFSGYLDTLDGEVARAKKTGGWRSGAFLDSSLDRYSDFFIACGIFLHYQRISAADATVGAVLLFLVFGSLMEDYAQAKAESLNADCSIGLFQRPERLIALGLSGIAEGWIQTAGWAPHAGILQGGVIFGATLIILAAGTTWISIRRIQYGYVQIRRRERTHGPLGD